MSETATMTITEFLLARIAEDEEAARDAGADAMAGWRWKHYPQDAYEEVQSLTLAHSRRVLAECEAKRRIVGRAAEAQRGADAWTAERLHTDTRSPLPDWARRDAYNEVLRDLALPYAEHPDYREVWHP